jgi:hypothetical protein
MKWADACVTSNWLVGGMLGLSWLLVGEATAQATKEPANGPAATTAESPQPVTAAPAAGPDNASIASLLLGNLSIENMQKLGEMLEGDWQNRPEWGDMAVALLKGEEMAMGMGWWRPAAKRYDWDWLRQRYDANADEIVKRDEWPASVSQADLLFARLDRTRDGQLDAADFTSPTPGGADRMQQMAQFLYFRLDNDSNGRITPDEVTKFFDEADQGNLGFLTPEDLLVGLDDPDDDESGESQGPTPQDMLRMFFRGELGVFESGPALGDEASDFTLPTHDGSRTVTLSSLRGQKPVVLIFGSLT